MEVAVDDGRAQAQDPGRPPSPDDADLLRLAMSEAAIGMCLVDADGAFLEVNQALCDFFGRDQADLTSRTWQELTHPDDLAIDLAQTGRALRGEIDRYELVKRFRHADGTDRVGRLVVRALHAADGTFRFFVSQIVDVTAQVAAERELAHSLERFRMLAESASDVVYRTDAHGRCTWISPSVTSELGWAPADLIGTAMPALVHPADLRAAEQARQAAVDAAGTQARPLELRYATRDGGWRWMSVRVRAVLDEEGRPDGGVTALRDVQEQVEARMRLRESEENFRVIAEHSSDVTMRTRRGIAEWVSPSVREVLGWQPADLLGRDLTDLVHPDDRPRLLAARTGATSDGTSALRYRVAHADGGWRWVEVLTRVVTTPDGVTDGAVGSVRDVHEAVEAQLALEGSRHLLRVTLDNLLDPWVLLAAVRDESGRIVDFTYADANPAACAVNGLSRSQLLGRRLLDLLPEHGPTGLLAAYIRVVETGEPLVLDEVAFPSARDRGQIRRFDNRAVRVGDGISLSWRDVTDRYEARQRDAEGARRDPLTGLANRTRLLERVEAAVREPGRRAGALLYCDLDRFKAINDRHGHAVGDQVLQEVAARIERTVGPDDLVARLGGDEFVVVLDAAAGQAEGIRAAERIRTAVAVPMAVEGTSQHVTVSVGIALLDRCGDPDRCLRAADAALYLAKARGRDCVVSAPV